MARTESEKKRDFAREAIPHMDFLYNYALRMTYKPEDAEDLVQETYLKAYRFWDSYQSGTNIRGWMFRILKNSFLNEHRKDSRQPEMIDYDAVKDSYHPAQDTAAAENGFHHDMFSHLLDDDVARAIAALPQDFRTVTILCDIEGMSYEEIAEFTKVPISTVRSRIHHARKYLYKTFQTYVQTKYTGSEHSQQNSHAAHLQPLGEYKQRTSTYDSYNR
ncbi:MAG: sigma-70 family RNA polymerase sigma factor [bacterium]